MGCELNTFAFKLSCRKKKSTTNENFSYLYHISPAERMEYYQPFICRQTCANTPHY